MNWQVGHYLADSYAALTDWQQRSVALRRASNQIIMDSRIAIDDSRHVLIEVEAVINRLDSPPRGS